MQIHLRPATPADADTVADVYLASRKKFVAYAPMAHPDADVRSWIRGTLIPSGGVTVAEVDGRIAGLVAVSQKARIGWIDQLYVAPELVRQGIGSRLLACARETLRSPIRLYTFQENQRARAFYEHHGFRAMRFGNGSGNEERCPDVLFQWLRESPAKRS